MGITCVTLYSSVPARSRSYHDAPADRRGLGAGSLAEGREIREGPGGDSEHALAGLRAVRRGGRS